MQEAGQGYRQAGRNIEESPEGYWVQYYHKDDVEAHKLEIGQTEEMLQEAQKVHGKAIAKVYKLLRNLLSGDAQSLWILFAARCKSVTLGLE